MSESGVGAGAAAGADEKAAQEDAAQELRKTLLREKHRDFVRSLDEVGAACFSRFSFCA